MAKNKLHKLFSVVSKASKRAPFVFPGYQIISCILFLSPGFITQADTNPPAFNCSENRFNETVKVDYVYDGDTIHLTDGRKLRLIGINTPEHGRDGKVDEPFYSAAKIQLKHIIEKSHGQLKLLFGNEQYDHYHRLLAHIFTPEGSNITATLLASGLGYSIAIPPNLKFLKCYQQAETKAKEQKKGLWNHTFGQPIDVAALDKSLTGFRQVIGTVQRVGESRSSFWLNLSNTFALRINKNDLGNFNDYQPVSLIHKRVIARGWIYQQNNEQRMSIRHPASLLVQSTD